ncbi:multifunctional 2',3'-cyclic-nucleotide 2'-phosphodiesterase/5'-nucleotidase/3'-nucleotidase [Saccharibacillus sp. O23]|uniref:bifunctional metallophosphatase/5'-nucleotidase n=1 Tax=Saccharibacillus sp. O23 TaxID=2009338 RepID=UPI000B4E6464|nr:bifunctional UDP-sugar hydrolase/5'-nucleotidase [Saccharibacillus sp. O23]OWR28039.1 multifunctional 2',3'-cyclic-nucleotide 2'-phosphodiesterase/5'-nucleotidase/3'-nucleotidase [Saccharibacillus sp. O23]
MGLKTEDRERLTILHTNDLHSHFEQMGRIAAFIAAEKARGNPVCTLDVGDHMDRMAIETEGSLGSANVDILNRSGYDAVTIGNNEGLTFTPEQLGSVYAALDCPVVCGNVKLEGGALPPWMRENAVIEKSGFRIGVLGLTAPFSDFYRLLGVEVTEPFAGLQDRVNELRGQVDVVVLLSHLGLASDERIAGMTQGIDLILGGHTHHLLPEPIRIGSTVVCAAGKFGRHIGRIVIARDASSGECEVREAGLIELNEDSVSDVRVDHAIARHYEEAAERLRHVAAVSETELPVDYERESEFGNLLAQSVRRFAGGEFSLVNSGQVLGPLPEGAITEGMLHALCPSPINPCVVTLRGSDILRSLEQSLLPEYTGKKLTGFGFRGERLGGLCADGLTIRYNPDAPPNERIVEARTAERVIAPEEEYRVATLDMFTFGAGYESLSRGTNKRFILPEFLRDLLRIELGRPGAAREAALPRWVAE